jgi:hypothetical protein
MQVVKPCRQQQLHVLACRSKPSESRRWHLVLLLLLLT